MLLRVPEVLTPSALARCRAIVKAADWADGRITAGTQSEQVKNNRQLAENSPVARRLGEMILTALSRNQLFFSAALNR